MKERDRWEKSAASENARRDARAPLFAHAGLVPHTTADEQQAKVERIQREFEERLAAHREQDLRKIDLMRQDLLALDGGADALAKIEQQYKGRWAPPQEYMAGTLNETIARLTGRTPLEVFEHYKERQRVEIVRVRVAVEDVRGLEIAVEEQAEDEAAEAERKAMR